jgi:hypothetical protein
MPPDDSPDWPALFGKAATLEQLRLLFGVWWTFFRERCPEPDAVVRAKDKRKAELAG